MFNKITNINMLDHIYLVKLSTIVDLQFFQILRKNAEYTALV